MKQPIYLAVALVALAGPAEAQRIDSPYRFLDHSQHAGVWVGYVNADEGRISIGPQPGVAFGATWGLRVSGPFAVGVDLAFLPTTRTVRDTAFVTADSMFAEIGEADVSLLLAQAGLRLNLTGARTWYGFQPFVLLGAGVAVDVAGSTAEESELDPAQRYDFGTSFAGSFGAGVDWFPTSRVSLRVDARNLLWKLRVPDAFLETQNGRGLPGSEWEQNLAVTAGLSIHF